MFYIIVMIVLGLIALAFLGVRLIATTQKGKSVATICGVGAVVLMLVLTFVMSMTIVSARSLSIVTSFGSYAGTIKPGLNWTAPWSDKESFPTTNQALDLTDYDEDKGDSVYVTFAAPKDVATPDAATTAGGGRGNVSSVVTWRISEDQGDSGAQALWRRYVSFDRVSSELVKAKAQEVIGDIANDVPAFNATVNYATIGRQARDQLGQVLKPYGIVVDSVSVKRIDLDPQTQASLQKIVDAINTTAAYREEKKAAEVQNQILQERQRTGALKEEANQRYCLDILKSWDVKEQGPLPATGISCFGSGSPAVVTVPAK